MFGRSLLLLVGSLIGLGLVGAVVLIEAEEGTVTTDLCLLNCDVGYVRNVTEVTFDNKTYTLVTCVPGCGVFPVANGDDVPASANGVTANVTCRSGLTPVPDTVTCLDGDWCVSNGICVATCGEMVVGSGETVPAGLFSGVTVDIVCNENTFALPMSTATCVMGEWSPASINCTSSFFNGTHIIEVRGETRTIIDLIRDPACVPSFLYSNNQTYDNCMLDNDGESWCAEVEIFHTGVSPWQPCTWDIKYEVNGVPTKRQQCIHYRDNCTDPSVAELMAAAQNILAAEPVAENSTVLAHVVTTVMEPIKVVGCVTPFHYTSSNLPWENCVVDSYNMAWCSTVEWYESAVSEWLPCTWNTTYYVDGNYQSQSLCVGDGYRNNCTHDLEAVVQAYLA